MQKIAIHRENESLRKSMDGGRINFPDILQFTERTSLSERETLSGHRPAMDALQFTERTSLSERIQKTPHRWFPRHCNSQRERVSPKVGTLGGSQKNANIAIHRENESLRKGLDGRAVGPAGDIAIHRENESLRKASGLRANAQEALIAIHRENESLRKQPKASGRKSRSANCNSQRERVYPKGPLM